MNNFNDARARTKSGQHSGHNSSHEAGTQPNTNQKRSQAQPKGPGSHNISEEARKRMAEGGRKGGTVSRRGPAPTS
ncbi:hypothetical protein BH11ARM2_BH11ARM2_00070 [soil metagenome]